MLDAEEDISYVVEPKFDGGSIAVVYENDQLIRGATRGNGVMGEEMTANARVIRSIPLKAVFSKHGIQKAELRGEVLIRKDIFAAMNEERVKLGLEAFANPRNTAAGGLRMKDPKEAWMEPPLPLGWEKSYDDEGNPYYIDHNSEKTSWFHPSTIPKEVLAFRCFSFSLSFIFEKQN